MAENYIDFPHLGVKASVGFLRDMARHREERRRQENAFRIQRQEGEVDKEFNQQEQFLPEGFLDEIPPENLVDAPQSNLELNGSQELAG